MKKTFYELFCNGDFQEEFKTIADAQDAAQSMEPDYVCVWSRDRQDENLMWGKTKHLGFLIVIYQASYSIVEMYANSEKYPMSYIQKNFPEIPKEDWILSDNVSVGGVLGPYIQFWEYWENYYNFTDERYLLRKILKNQQEQIDILKKALDRAGQ